MKNYFNSLPFRKQVEQLGKCDFLPKSEFENGVNALFNKKIVIVGGYEAYKIGSFLKTNQVAVLLKRVHDMPENDDDDVDLVLDYLMNDSSYFYLYS